MQNKRGPGEIADDQIPIPSFTTRRPDTPESEIRVQMEDCDAFPSTLSELHDPAKHTVLVTFGTFLKRTLESGRQIEPDEQDALRAIKAKLQTLVIECQTAGKRDWEEYVQRRVTYIETSFGI